MFREMRRKKQELSYDENIHILNKATSGVLALAGDDDYPYAVPLSYVYSDGKLFFHCAKSGYKLDSINRNNKASFCVIAQDIFVPEEYATLYRSVIVFGTIRIIDDDKQKREAIEKLAIKYAPQHDFQTRDAAIKKDWDPLCMLEMTIEHISGKEALGLAKARQDTK
ncbi:MULTISPECIES: pyridoxamine 5'-phosphate oxidase family protein [unclassified Ruminococcus]|uniref:pyridoxamine 5'-phosphate oxidase family protein n=1 Tax=unclassified Ruminococcus TaxID=2608920 RepID=UPI00210F0664|nr:MULTISPECIES: pyridoxamine 5'-phosphate oxidase family protein [unclassified Ruminococcus]MCQ4021677.1 5-nitroimidazole antibiotic resistance protein [Ruminococcus sp. zg-924]MCQ4114122.1 5-nitroimidazole antibiotic resistance protein [Ruminococcus sp. zg-921]